VCANRDLALVQLQSEEEVGLFYRKWSVNIMSVRKRAQFALHWYVVRDVLTGRLRVQKNLQWCSKQLEVSRCLHATWSENWRSWASLSSRRQLRLTPTAGGALLLALPRLMIRWSLAGLIVHSLQILSTVMQLTVSVKISDMQKIEFLTRCKIHRHFSLVLFTFIQKTTWTL
jgi:hypothetical protein